MGLNDFGARMGWEPLACCQPCAERRAAFRFLHVSTDEVYGSLRPDDPHSRKPRLILPTARARHLKRLLIIWSALTTHTYGLPTLATNCSNNYGPYQFPEKLIPLVVEGKPMPVYGDLVSMSRDRETSPELRAQIHLGIAPYLYPKRKPVDESIDEPP